MATEEQIRNSLQVVIDPEIGMDIVNLGLVYDVKFDETQGKADIKMTLTSPACPVGPQIVAKAKEVAGKVEGVKDVNLEIVWTPPWNPEMMTEEAKDKLGIY
jgi:metal-sulfur cluster biosynthetic enzyme